MSYHIRINEVSCALEVGLHELRWSGRQHEGYGSSFQVMQTLDCESITVFASANKCRCASCRIRTFLSASNSSRILGNGPVQDALRSGGKYNLRVP